MLLVSLLSASIGISAGIVAFVLYNLIGLFTNLAFYQRFSLSFASPRFNTLGPLVIVIPVIGGIVVGIMAKYGTPKIKGHGIPEAIEAVLVSRSRIEPKVALLKPLSAAVAIGTGCPFGAEGPNFQTDGALGSIFALPFNQVVPGAHLDPGAFALVAMGAMFGAASRAFFTLSFLPLR